MKNDRVERGRRRYLKWVGHDARTILIARGLRTLGQSTVALLLALYLQALGLSLIQIGVVLSVDVAGTAAMATGVTLVTNRTGRRRTLVAIMVIGAVASVAVGIWGSLFLLLPAIFLGSFTAGAGAGGPVQPLELASLTEVAPARRRTQMISMSFIAGQVATALGALAVGLPVLVQHWSAMGDLAAYRLIFLLYAVIQLTCALLYSRLSPAVEGDVTKRQWTNPMRLKSRKRIFTLTALFSMDSFAASLVVQSLIAYWFTTRFGIDLAALSVVFFLSSVLGAVSLWAAARIADRFGLLKTMVFAHTPASLLLIGAAFSPVAWVAVMFWLLRSLLALMDAPTRESYTMAIVEPDERVAMAGIHGVGRSVAGIVGPTIGTALWNGVAAAAPFVASGFLRIGYDVALYVTFRNVKPPEEARPPVGGGVEGEKG